MSRYRRRNPLPRAMDPAPETPGIAARPAQDRLLRIVGEGIFGCSPIIAVVLAAMAYTTMHKHMEGAFAIWIALPMFILGAPFSFVIGPFMGGSQGFAYFASLGMILPASVIARIVGAKVLFCISAVIALVMAALFFGH